jgi:hypothetical protein
VIYADVVTNSAGSKFEGTKIKPSLSEHIKFESGKAS